MRIRHLLIIIFLGWITKGFSQTITCFKPTLGVEDGSNFSPMTNTVSCDYSNLIRIAPANVYSVDIFGNPVAAAAPCMRLETSLTNLNATTNNSITVFQGTTNIGSICNTCASSVPPNMLYTLYYAGLDPSQTHAYALCHSASAANMTYTVMSCYSNVVLASGTWTNTTGPGCQTVNIPAGSAIGTSSYAITPTISASGFFDLGNSSLYLDTYYMSAGTYTVTYTFNSQTGCTTTQTIAITITNPYSAAWTNIGAQCSNGPCVNLPPQVTGTSGGSWSGPAVTSGSFCPSSVGTGSFATTYTVGVSPTCGATLTQTVVVNPQPIANAGPTKSITCAQPTSTVLSGSGGGLYSWSGPGIIAGGATANPTVNATPGVYSLVTTSLGCVSNPATVQVVVDQNPPNPGTIPSNTITCLNPTVTAAITPTAGMTYTWVASPGNIVSGSSTSSATVNQAGTYNFTVTNSATGCLNNGFVTVTSNTNVSNTPSTTNTVTCSNLNIGLSTAVSGTGPFTYTWTAPAGSSITSGLFSQNATASGAGVYSITVKDASNGCTRTATIAANVNTTAPTATASAGGAITCTSNTITLTVNPGGLTYAWTAGGGGSITSGASSQNATGAGNGIYSVLVTAANGCTVMATTTPSVNQVAITPTIAAPGVLTCSQNTISLSGTPSTGVTYTWSAPSGTNIVSGANNATVAVNAPVIYTLAITNTVNGCVGTKTVQPTQSLTTPTLSAPSLTANLVCGASSVVLSGSALPAGSTATWTSAGGGFASGVNNFTVAATTATTYVLSAANPTSGCIASLTYTVIPDVNSPTVTLSSPTGTLTCLTTVLSTTATSNPSSGVTYTWSGPGIVGSANGAAVTASLAGTYNLAVTNTSNSCVSNVSYIVTANNSPVTPTATSSNTLTCNTLTTSVTAGAGAGTYTYSWSGPSSFTGTAQSFTTATGGTYTVQVTNTSSGCTGSITLAVSVNTIAPSSLTVTPSSYTLPCAPPTGTLAAGATGAASYSWTAPSGGTILSGATTATAVISGPGSYSVIAIGSNGCASTVGIAAVSQSTDAPTYTLSNASPSITCLSASPTVSVAITSTVPIMSYSWSPAAGISGATNTSVATFTLAGTYTAQIIATNGCESDVILTVANATMAPTMVAGTGTASVLGCGSNSVVTIAPTFTPASSSYTYAWSGPGIVGSANNSSVSVNVNGTYSLSVTNTLTGCSTTSITIPVFGTTIAPTLTIASTSSIGIGCTPTTSTITLTANSTPSTNVTYNWSSSATTSAIALSTPGTYSVTVTDATSGCTVSASYVVANNTIVPTVNAGANGALPCGASGTYTLNGSSTTAGVTYSWTGAGLVSGAVTPAPVINQPGIYTLTVANPTTGCVASGTVAIASSSVTAAFTPDQTTGVSPLTVNFTNTSTGAINYSWDFGNGATSTQTNTSATYSMSQTYTVTLIATSGLCSDTARVNIVVNDGLTLEIPNVFTPNDDGVNDVFTITSTGVKEISLQIFNRWGQRMYEISGAAAAWDGMNFSGQKVSDGTYFYFVKATGFDGKEISKNGSLSLFR